MNRSPFTKLATAVTLALIGQAAAADTDFPEAIPSGEAVSYADPSFMTYASVWTLVNYSAIETVILEYQPIAGELVLPPSEAPELPPLEETGVSIDLQIEPPMQPLDGVLVYSPESVDEIVSAEDLVIKTLVDQEPLIMYSTGAVFNFFSFTPEMVLLAPAANVSTVPIPAAAWLFGTALAGLGMFNRRRKPGKTD